MQDPNFLHEITTSVDLHRNFNPGCITDPGESCLPESPLSHIKGDAANPLRAFCAPEYSESCVSLADFIRNAAATHDPTGTGGVGEPQRGPTHPLPLPSPSRPHITFQLP
jgi:hypothetical protein